MIETINPIHPCLWFDKQALEATQFYTSIFKNSRILTTQFYGDNMHMPKGTVLTTLFEIKGMQIMALNGGPMYTHSPAISLVANCDDQAEIDHVWQRLLEGGQAVQCGWLTDKFGVSWQVVPSGLFPLFARGDQAATNRMMAAVMRMIKLDWAEMQRAYFAH
jgi:predicted 3-demethylubiquinone-9 3-methyltransferase (glyoxalase superfamily)